MASSGRGAVWLLAAVAALVTAGTVHYVARGRGSSQATPPRGASLPSGAPSAATGAVSTRSCANGSLPDVRRIVGEILRRDDVNPGLTLAELHADDLDLVEIVMAIEDHCSLEIPDSDIEAGLKMTVEQLARLVDRKVQAKGAGR